ncbi:MAG: hypothetical protein KR126chlam1_00501 [Chlamydiae bacterium]|nr:hypothetical protein [Chlamydiota bacterium]
MSRYVVARTPTPLFNIPNFAPLLREEKLPLEMIALPRTKFSVLEEISETILKAVTNDYPHGPVYLDVRFTRGTEEHTPERAKTLPSKWEILKNLKRTIGLPYLWGGNHSPGIPEFSLFYKNLNKRILQGVDCSGLLYEATSGWTPRNTSELYLFGEEIASYRDPIHEICQRVKRLDILVWPGHVIIVYDKETTIESLEGKGVLFQPLEARISSLQPHTCFSLRRIFPNTAL